MIRSTTMERSRLSLRIDADNPRHHLWNNNGSWWIHYTLHTPENRIRRVRRSLNTGDLTEARLRRDEVLRRLLALEGGEGRALDPSTVEEESRSGLEALDGAR
jgi:hypothetical protein